MKDIVINAYRIGVWYLVVFFGLFKIQIGDIYIDDDNNLALIALGVVFDLEPEGDDDETFSGK